MANPAPSISTEAVMAASAEEGDGRPVYHNFLDDPFNMAMYVVLPVMIVVYGGCCFIYCMAKLHRYCRRRARKRARLQLIGKDGDHERDDNNITNNNNNNNNNRVVHRPPSQAFVTQGDIVSVVDLTQEQPCRPPVVKSVHPPPVPPKPVARRSPATAAVVRPGYTRNRGYQENLQQQMQHLDDQLKAAFRMIAEEPQKSRSRPDVCAKNGENRKPVKKRADSKLQLVLSDQ